MYIPTRLSKSWTKEEDEQLIQFAQSGKYNYSTIAKFLGRTSGSCNSRLSNLNYSSNYIAGKKYTCNEDFWKEPNPINSFYAGMSAADGYVSNRGVYQLLLQTRDYYFIKKMQEITNISRNPLLMFRCLNNKIYPYSYIRTNTNYKWTNDLKNNFNITPQKTHRLSPPNNLDSYLKKCFLIGYICGDGCVYMGDWKKFMFSVASSSYSILEWIKEELELLAPKVAGYKPNYIKKRKNFNYYLYRFCGLHALVVLDFLRKFPLPKFQRKFEQLHINEYILQKKREYPNLFYNDLVIPKKWTNFPKYENIQEYDIIRDEENIINNPLLEPKI